MASKYYLLQFTVWITIQNIAEAVTTPAPTIPSASASTAVPSTNLSCYDCSESFKYVWEPYTECQYYPMQAALRPCLVEERYCKIERVTYKSLTVSITRGCTKECWHGCYASGFGLTKLKCTSCCLTPGCNIGNAAYSLHGRHFYIDLDVLLATCIMIITYVCNL